MGTAKKTGDRFPHVKGLAKKRTKFGHRWILTEKDSTGKSCSITVKILDTDTEDTFWRKVSDARAELRRKDRAKTFDSYFKEFCIINQLQQGTIRMYRYALKGFSFNQRTNAETVRKLIQSENKITTIRLRIGQVNRFFSWCISRGAPVINPVLNIKIKDKHVPRSRIFTESEMDKLLSYVNRREPEYQLYVLLLINTGARVSTIAALKANDFVDGKLYLYNTKCQKPYDYPIPVSNQMIIELWNYVTQDGVLWHKRPNTYYSRLKSWLIDNFSPDANGERLSPHSLRHTFATRAVQNGASVDIVSKLLDHATPTMTLKVYARFSQSQIDDAVLKATKKPT